MQVNANVGCAARAHVTRASAIRAHAQRFPLAVFVFLFALFVAKVAYADDWYTVLYQSNLDDHAQYIVSADDKWQAAAIICGKSKSFIDGLDDATRKKLATNGGSFQTLAESLDKDWPAWNEDTLSQSLSETFGGNDPGSLWREMTNPTTTIPTYPFVGINTHYLDTLFVDIWQETCPTAIFAINADADLRVRAIEALDLIVGGGSIGGSAEIADQMTFPLENHPLDANINPVGAYTTYYTYNSGVYYLMFTKGSQTYNYPTGNTLTITGLSQRFDLEQYSRVVVLLRPTGRYGNGVPWENQFYLVVMCASDDLSVNFDDATQKVTFTATNLTGRFWQYVRFGSTDFGTFPKHFEIDVTNNAGTNLSIVNKVFDYGFMYGDSATSGTGGGGDDEPNPWPKPVPPEQPSVPDPPDVSPPPITGPVFPTNPPEDPIVTPEPEPTGTDYTVYLKAIIRQLNKVIDQMGNHCKHIRDQISTSANAIISNMHTFIGDLQESIDSNFAALNDYLEDLTTWYEDFTQEIVDGIQDDISTVESILRQILRKMGVGRGTQKDVEKDVDDDFNFLEWLINFITSKLSGVIGDFVGDVGGLIAGVKDKFPFSVPWDIAAILALLDGVPTTPVFTITIPAINGWWQETRFVIDLHPFDSVASAARIMINAWWVLVLVMKTNWLLMIMGDSTSIGERTANRMTGGE